MSTFHLPCHAMLLKRLSLNKQISNNFTYMRIILNNWKEMSAKWVFFIHDSFVNYPTCSSVQKNHSVLLCISSLSLFHFSISLYLIESLFSCAIAFFSCSWFIYLLHIRALKNFLTSNLLCVDFLCSRWPFRIALLFSTNTLLFISFYVSCFWFPQKYQRRRRRVDFIKISKISQ